MEQQHVQVFGRVRPLNDRELSKGGSKVCATVCSSDALTPEGIQNTIVIDGNPESRMFTFDAVLGPDDSQENVFDVVAKDLVEEVVQGFNGTIFAYGQTGSGKTYTILGPDLEELSTALASTSGTAECKLPPSRGLLPRALDYLFEKLKEDEQDSESSLSFKCKCSFLEIYNEKIIDLLEPTNSGLQLRESVKKGVYVERQTERKVETAAEALGVMISGHENRSVGSTEMNKESSRSHCVFTVVVETIQVSDGMTRSRTSKFNLIDLAGSERQSATGSTDATLVEAQHINTSLSTLGRVISALAEQAQGKTRHVHYRDSKLTFLLRDSLGGNSKTHMIANISPSSDCYGESLSTLKFAQRAKLIKNSIKVNEDTSGTVMVLQGEIQKLQKELQDLRQGELSRRLSASFPSSIDDARLIELEELLRIMAKDGSTFLNREQLLQDRTQAFKDKCVALEKTLLSQRTVVKFRDRTIEHLKATLARENKCVECSECDSLREELATMRQMVDCHPDVVSFRAKLNEKTRLLELAVADTAGTDCTALKDLLRYELGLREVNEGLSHQIERFIAEKERIRNGEEDPELIELREKLTEMESSLLDEKSRSLDLETKVGEINVELSIAKAEMSQVEIVNQELRQNCSVLDQVRELQVELSGLVQKFGDCPVSPSRSSFDVVTKLKSTVAAFQEQASLREAKLTKEISVLRDENENIRSNLQHSEKSLEQLQSDHVEMKTSLQEQLESVTCALSQEKVFHEQVQVEFRELEEKHHFVQREVQFAAEELNTCHDAAHQLDHELKALKESSSNRIIALDAEVSSLRNILKTTEESLAESEGQLTGLRLIQQELQNMVDMQQAKEKTDQLRILALQKDLETATTELQVAASKHASLEEKHRDISVAFENGKLELSNLHENLKQLATAKTETEQLLEKNTLEAKSLASQLATKVETITSLTASLDVSNAKLHDTELALKDIKVQLEQERCEGISKQSQIAGMMTDLELKSEQFVALTQERNFIAEEREEVQKKLETEVELKSQLEADLSKLKQTLDTQSEEIEKLQTSIANSNELMSSKERECEQLSKEIEDFQTALNERETSLQQEKELSKRLEKSLDTVNGSLKEITTDLKVKEEQLENKEEELQDEKELNAKLTTEYESTAAELASRSEKLDHFENELELLQKKLEESNSTLNTTRDTLKEKTDQLIQLETELAIAKAAEKTATENLNQSMSRLEEVSLMNDQLESKVATARDAENVAIEEKMSLEREFDSLTHEHKKMTELYRRLDEEHRSKVNEYELKCNEVSTAEQQLTETTQSLQEMASEHACVVHELEAKAENLSVQLEESLESLNIANDVKRNTESELNDSRVELENTKKELQCALEKLENLHTKLEGSSTELENAKRELMTGQLQLTETNSDLEAARNNLEVLQSDLTNAESQIARISAKFGDIEAENTKLRDAVVDYKHRMRDQAKAAQDKMKLKVEENHVLKAEVKEVKLQVVSLNTELETAQEKAVSLSRSLEVATAARNAAESNSVSLTKRNEALSEELATAKKELFDAVQENEAIQSNLTEKEVKAAEQQLVVEKLESDAALLENKVQYLEQELEKSSENLAEIEGKRKSAETRVRKVEMELVDAKLDTSNRTTTGHQIHVPKTNSKLDADLKERSDKVKARAEAVRKSAKALRGKLAKGKEAIAPPLEKENTAPEAEEASVARRRSKRAVAKAAEVAIKEMLGARSETENGETDRPVRRAGLRKRNVNVTSP